MDGDDDSLLVDVDFSAPHRSETEPAQRDTTRRPDRSGAAAHNSDVVDLTSDCEDAVDTSGQRNTTARPLGEAACGKRHWEGGAAEARQPAKRSQPASRAALQEEWRPADRPASHSTAAEAKAERAAQKKRDAEAKKAQKELEKQEKARQKQEAKEAKAAQKAAEKAEKSRQKEQVRQQRGRLADQEIQAVLSTEMAMLQTGHQAMEKLTAKQFAFTIAPAPLAPLPCLSWRRRQVVGGSDSQGADEGASPAAEAEEEVPYILVYLKADDFVTEVERGSVEGLIKRAAAAHPTCTLCLLIDGLHHYVEQRERREFRQAGGAGAIGAMQTFGRRATEEAVMRLVTHYPGVRHRIVHDAAQAAEHIVMLTRALAHQPYKYQDMFLEVHGAAGDSQASASLLTRAPLPPGREPFYRVLNYTPSMGPASAHIIATQYPSLGCLMTTFLDPSTSDAQKMKLISALEKPTENRRRVGPAAAQKLLRVLTATDPDLPVQG